jgi:hypothetical protein
MVPVPRLCTHVDFSTGTYLPCTGRQTTMTALYPYGGYRYGTQGIEAGVTQTKGWEDVTEELGVLGGRGWRRVRFVTY